MVDTDLARAVGEFLVSGGLEDPGVLYEQMADADAVMWCPVDGGFWAVSSFDVAIAVLGDADQFVRRGMAPRLGIARDTGALEAQRVRMVLQDDPVHARVRSLVSRAFTPRAVAQLRSHAVEITERLVAAVYDRGHMEVQRDFSYPFTVEMIASMMGLPVRDGPKLIDWTQASIARRVDEASMRGAEVAAQEMHEYFVHHAYPADGRTPEGIIGALAAAEIDGDRLTERELTGVCEELVAAGHETTANMIPNALATLLQHPEQMELVRADRALLAAAVEECLRYQPPLPSPIPFLAVNDVELGGKAVSAGDRVCVWISAANRDPAAFERPNEFDVTRPGNRHLSLSHGTHFCLGASLARMEVGVALDQLLDLPELALVDPPPVWRTIRLRALESLPVRWTAVERSSRAGSSFVSS